MLPFCQAEKMFPVLLNIGPITVSSLGFFLVLSLFLSAFVVWRLAIAYELDREKTLDLIFITFISGFIGARAYFVLNNLNQFDTFLKMIWFSKYPGLSFWGGVVLALIVLPLAAKRLKVNFYQIADFGIVGVFLGIAVTSFGCLFAGCQYGLPTTWPIGVEQVGIVDKRFPLQIFESLAILFIFFYLWRKVVRYHKPGQVAGIGLILLGFIKFIFEFFRGDSQYFMSVKVGFLFALAIIILGIWVYYKNSKKTVLGDVRYTVRLTYDQNKRRTAISKMQKNWYNLFINLKISWSRFIKKLSKLLNVKSNPNKF